MKLGRGGKKKATQLSSLMTIIILLETLWRHTAGTAAQSCEKIKILESFKVWHAAALLKRKKPTTTQKQDGMRGWITNSFPFAILFPPCSSPCSVSRQRGSTEREKKKAFSFCDFWWTSLTSWRRWAYYISTSLLITTPNLWKRVNHILLRMRQAVYKEKLFLLRCIAHP